MPPARLATAPAELQSKPMMGWLAPNTKKSVKLVTWEITCVGWQAKKFGPPDLRVDSLGSSGPEMSHESSPRRGLVRVGGQHETWGGCNLNMMKGFLFMSEWHCTCPCEPANPLQLAAHLYIGCVAPMLRNSMSPETQCAQLLSPSHGPSSLQGHSTAQ